MNSNYHLLEFIGELKAFLRKWEDIALKELSSASDDTGLPENIVRPLASKPVVHPKIPDVVRPNDGPRQVLQLGDPPPPVSDDKQEQWECEDVGVEGMDDEDFEPNSTVEDDEEEGQEEDEEETNRPRTNVAAEAEIIACVAKADVNVGVGIDEIIASVRSAADWKVKNMVRDMLAREFVLAVNKRPKTYRLNPKRKLAS